MLNIRAECKTHISGNYPQQDKSKAFDLGATHVDAKLKQANLYYEYFLYNQVIAICKEINLDTNGDNDATLLLAKAYSELLQFSSASSNFIELHKNNPIIADYAYNVVLSNIKIQKYKDALKIINELLTLNPNNNDYLYCRSNIYFIIGNLKLCVEDLDQLNDEYYIHPLVISNELIKKENKQGQNLLYITTQHLNKILKYYHYILLTYGNLPFLQLLIACTYKALGNFDKYRNMLKLLVNTDQNFMKDYTNLNYNSIFSFDLYYDPFTNLWLQIKLIEKFDIDIKNEMQFANYYFENDVRRFQNVSSIIENDEYKQNYQMARIFYAEALRIDNDKNKSLEIIQKIYDEDTINPYASFVEGHIRREELNYQKAIDCYTYSSRALRRKKMEMDMFGLKNKNKDIEIYNKNNNDVLKWNIEHMLQLSMSCLAACYRCAGRDIDCDNVIIEAEKYVDKDKSVNLLYQKCVSLFYSSSPKEISNTLELFINCLNDTYIFKNGLRNSECIFLMCYPGFYNDYSEKMEIEKVILNGDINESLQSNEEIWIESYKLFFLNEFKISQNYIELLRERDINYIYPLNKSLTQIRGKKYKLPLETLKPKDFAFVIQTSDDLVKRYIMMKEMKLPFELLFCDLSKSLLIYSGQIDGRWQRALLLKENKLYEIAKDDVTICIEQTKKEKNLENITLDLQKKLKLRLISFQIELGLLNRYLNDLPKALSCFSDVIKLDENDPCARAHRAYIYVLEGDYGQATIDLDICVKACENSQKQVDERYKEFVGPKNKLKYLIQLAAVNSFIGYTCKLLYDNFHNCDDIFDTKIFESDPIKLPKKTKRGGVLNPSIDIIVNQYYFQKAYKYFKKAKDIDPTYPDIYYFEGLMYSKCWLTDLAINSFSQCIKLNPEHYEAMFARGSLYISRQDYGKAMTDLDEVCTKNDKTKGVHTSLGLVYFFLEDYVQSISHFDEALIQDSNNIDALYLGGCTFLKCNMLNKALEYFDKVINLDPKHMDAYLKKGYTLSLEKRYSEALSCFAECLKYVKNDLTMYEYHAQCYYLMFDMQSAIDEYTALLGQKFDSNLGNIAANRGLTYNTQKDYKKAMMDYETAVRMDPSNPFARLYRALGHIKERHLEEALTDLMIAAPELKKIVYFKYFIGCC